MKHEKKWTRSAEIKVTEKLYELQYQIWLMEINIFPKTDSLFYKFPNKRTKCNFNFNQVVSLWIMNNNNDMKL